MKRYKSDQIDELVEILKNEGVISVPTDTIYGLCAKANSKKACKKVMELKKRPLNQTLAIMCADEEQVKSVAIVGEREEKIIKRFMPGPITLILPKIPEIPEIPECMKNGTVGIRMATTKSLEKLIKKLESPICLTSANKSGEPICKTLEEIEEVFPDLDGIMEGKVFFGIGSTIVDCTSNEIKILREGPISLEQILETIKN